MFDNFEKRQGIALRRFNAAIDAFGDFSARIERPGIMTLLTIANRPGISRVELIPILYGFLNPNGPRVSDEAMREKMQSTIFRNTVLLREAGLIIKRTSDHRSNAHCYELTPQGVKYLARIADIISPPRD